ncbi:uncharacterized protein ACB058_017753 isoform 2-T3 [Synchiropus picturatus]
MGGTQSAQRLDETHAAAGEREEPEQVEDAEAQLRDKPIKVQLSDIDGKEGVSLVNTNGHYEDTKAEDGEETFETINITDKDVSNEGSGVGEQNITLEVTSMEAKQNDINDSFRRFFSSIGFRLTVNQPKTQTEEPSAPDNTGHPPTETGEEKVGLVELKEEEKSSDPTVCSTLIDVTSDDLRDNTDDQTPQRQVDAAAEAASSTVGEASHVQQDTKVDEEQRPTSPSSHDWEVLGSPMKKFFTTGIFSGLRKKKKTEDLDTTGVGGRERETSKVADEDRQKESGPVEEAAAQDKDKEKVETQEEKAMEPEIVSSLEKERVQASPLRRLFASPSLRRFAKKQQEKIPSEPGEHASDEQTSDERSKDEDSKETKVEENSAWASFKKLMTPKKTLKKPDEEPQTEQAQKLSDGDKLSDSSSEQSRKRKDSSVSWEAVLCGSGRRRSNRNSQEELPGTNHSKSKNDRAADEESEDAGASSLKQAEHSPDSEGGFTWNSFKRLITPKRKAREDEDAGSKFIVLMTQDELSVPAESDVKSARKARDEAATAESDEESETPAVIPLSEFQDDLIPAEEKTHVPMDENATQRSDSPALDSEDPKVEDLAAVSEMKVILDEFTEAISKHPQLSDIPEESAVPETMAPPVEEEPAGDDTLAEDLTDITSDAITAPEPADFTLTDETEMMSAVSQLSESPKSGASTPVPAYYSLEETEKVLAQVVETISAATLMTPLSSEEVNVERIVGSISNQSLATVFKDEPALLEIHRKSDTSNIQTGLNVEEMVGEKNVEATVELESLSGISKALYTEMTSEVAPEDLEQAEMAVDEVLVLQSEEVQIQHAGSKTKVEDSELMSEESGVEGALKEADEGEDLKVAMVDELQIERSDLKETVVQTMEIFISTAEPVTDTEEVGHEEELSPLTDVNKTHDEECHDRSTDSSMVVSGDGPHADSAGGEKQETPAEESIVSTEEHNAQIVKKEKPLNDLSGDRQTDNESESEPLEDLKTQRTTEAESEAGKQQHLQESIDHDQEPDQAKSEESCGPLSASKERPLGATPQGEILEEHPALDDQVLVEESSGEPGELTTSGSEGFLTETTPEEPEGKQTDVSGDNMTQETQEMESSVETQETVSEVEVLSGDSLDMGKCPTETKAEKDGGEAESVPDQNVQKNRALEHWSRGTGEEDTRQVKDMAEHPPPSTLISPPQELQAPQTEPVVDPEDAPCVEEVSSEETTPGPSEEAETDSVSEDKLLREETDEKDSDLEETPDMTAVESVVQRSEESEERFDSNSVQKEETREAATEPVDSVGLSSQDVLSMVIPERGLVTGSEEAQSPVQHHTPEFSDAMEAAGKVELKLSQSEVTDTTQPRETEDTGDEEVEKELLLVETATATTLDMEQNNAESDERVAETETVSLVEGQENRETDVEPESPQVEAARKTSAGLEQREVEVSGEGDKANTDQSEERSSLQESTKEQSPVENVDCASEDTEETDVVSEDTKEKTEDPESVKCSIANVETPQPDQPREEDLSAPEVLSEKEAVRDPDVAPENESSLNPEQCFAQITETVVREAPAQTVQAEDLRDQEVETPKDEDTSPDSVDHIYIQTHPSEDSVDLEDTNTAPAEKQDELSKENLPPSILIRPEEPEAPQTDSAVDPEDTPSVEEVPTEETTPGLSEEVENDPVSDEKLLTGETHEKDSDIEETPDMTAVESVVQRPGDSEDKHHQEVLRRKTTMDAEQSYVETVECAPGGADVTDIFPKEATEVAVVEERGPQEDSESLKCCQTEDTPQPDRPSEEDLSAPEDLKQKEAVMDPDVAPENESSLNPEQCFAQITESVVRECPAQTVQAEDLRDQEVETPRDEDTSPVSVDHQDILTHASEDSVDLEDTITAPAEKQDDLSNENLPPSILIRPEEPEAPQTEPAVDPEDTPSVEEITTEETTPGPSEEVEKDKISDGKLLREETDEKDSDIEETPDMTAVESVVQRSGESEDKHHQEVLRRKTTMDAEQSYVETAECAPGGADVTDIFPEKATEEAVVEERGPQEDSESLKCCQTEDTPQPDRPSEEDLSAPEDLKQKEAVMDPDVAPENESSLNPEQCFAQITESVVREAPAQTVQAEDLRDQEVEMLKDEDTSPVSVDHQDILTHTSEDSVDLEDTNTAPAEKQDDLSKENVPLSILIRPEEPEAPQTDSAVDPCVEKVPCEETPGPSEEAEMAPVSDEKLLREETDEKELVPEDTSLTAESENLTVTLTQVQEENVSDGEQEASLDEEEHSLGVLQRVVDEATAEELVVDHDAALWAKAAETEEQKEAAAEEPAHKTECGVEEPRTENPEENAAHIQPENEEAPAAGPAAVCSDLDPPQAVEELTKEAEEEGVRGEEQIEDPAGDTPEFSDAMEAAEQVELELSQSEVTGTPQVEDEEEVVTGGEHREEQASGLKAVDGTDSTEDAARAVKEELSTGGIPEDQTPGTEATSEQEMRPADQETQDSLQVERSWESEQLNVQVVERAVEEALQEEVLQDVLKEETQIDDTKTYVVESEQRREAGGCGPVSEVAADGPHEEQPPASAAAGECRVQTARSVEEEKGQDRVPGTTVKKEILAASGDQIHHPEASEDSDVRSKEDAEETGKSRGIPAGDAVEEGGHRTGTKSDEPAEDTEQSRIHIAKRDEDVGMKSETVLVGTNLVQPTEGVSQVEPEEDQTSTDLCEDKEESQAMKRDSASLEPEPRNELPCRVEQKEGQAEESEAVEVWRRAELLIQRKPHHHHSPSTEPDDIVEAAPEPHTDTAAPTRKEVFAVEDTQGKRCPRPAAESEESEDMMVAGHSQQHHPSLITVQLETKLVQREEPRNTVGALSMSATEAYLSTEESSLIPETISFKENVLTHGAEVTEELKATALPCEEQKEYSGEVASPDVEAHEAEPAAAADLSDVSPPQCRTDRALELKKIIVTSTMHLAHVMKETVEEIRVVTVPHVEGEDERESTVHLMSGVKIMESTHLHTSFGRKNEDVLQHVEEQHETPTEALMDLEENDGKPRSVSDHSKDQRCEEMDEEDQRDGLQLSSDPDQVGETSEADEEAPMFEYLANNVSMEGPCLETTTPESGTIPTAEKAALQVPELSVRVDEAQDFLDLSLSEAAPEDEAQIEKMEEPDRQSASKETAVIFSPLVIVIQAIQETEDDLRRATGRQRAPEKLAKSQVDGSEQASAKDDEDVWLDAEESILTEEEEAVSHVEEFVDADEEEGEEQGEASDSFEIAPDHSAEVKESVADTLLETASDTEEFTAALEDPDVPTTTVAIAE